MLGMHEVGWEGDRYTPVEKNATLAKTTKGTASPVTANGYDLSNVNGVNGDVASYLFERQGVATSFTKSVTMDENTFAGKHWAVNDKSENVSRCLLAIIVLHLRVHTSLFVLKGEIFDRFKICIKIKLLSCKHATFRSNSNENNKSCVCLKRNGGAS